MVDSRRVFETPVGRMALVATRRGLARVILPKEFALHHVSASAGAGKARAYAARAEREICEYLAGRRCEFTVPLDMAGLPAFQRKVLGACRWIPYGRTVTYGELAARAGRPRAARAVGQAMARNPLALVVPCHRVAAAGGGLGGYGGGLDLKRQLLALEGSAR